MSCGHKFERVQTLAMIAKKDYDSGKQKITETKKMEVIDRRNRSFLYKDKYFLLYKDFRKAYADSARIYISDVKVGEILDRPHECQFYNLQK